jgi:hypothetical protein
MKQPTLFEQKRAEGSADAERLALYALGEFQARGKTLAARELPLDRLRGALRRAAEAFGVAALEDEAAVAALAALGAHVSRVPPYVAKHPYRVTAPPQLAARARSFYDRHTRSEQEEA